MNKNLKIIVIIVAILMVIWALVGLSDDETNNWDKNFDAGSKSPFGLYVFNKESKDLFAGKLEKTDRRPTQYFKDKKPVQNILLIKSKLDVEEWVQIVDEVNRGSDLMVIGSEIPKMIKDSIGYESEIVSFEPANVLKLTDKKFQDSFLKQNKFPYNLAFTYIHPEVEILGKTVEDQTSDQPNFITRKIGKGRVFIHSEPLFITNYYLLQSGNLKYTQNVFSYLDDRETVWFTDVKVQEESRSVMRFILANPSLKYAWWLLLGGLILFTVFNIKRKQRIIQVTEPLKNTSVDFVRSIGNLYLQEGDFHDMMAKKAQYFLNRVRVDLLIDTQNLDEDFIKKLHLKTGKPIDKIAEATEYLKKAQDPYAAVMQEDLAKMNTLLDQII